jgi:hypothetical protein
MIVSIGVREIRPFIKCKSILDLALESSTVSLVLSPASMPSVCSATPSTSFAYTGSLLLGILFLDVKW